VKVEEFQADVIDIVTRNTTLDGKLSALNYRWGTAVHFVTPARESQD